MFSGVCRIWISIVITQSHGEPLIIGFLPEFTQLSRNKLRFFLEHPMPAFCNDTASGFVRDMLGCSDAMTSAMSTPVTVTGPFFGPANQRK
jgi:hypothetical protein